MTSPRILWFLGLIWALGGACKRSLPEAISSCPDESCRAEWVIAAFARDTAEGTDALDGLEDPLEKIALVSRLVETYPGKTLKLCDKLTQGPPRERCRRINTRPHLWSDPPEAAGDTSRAGVGPATVHLPTLDRASSRYAAVAPLAGPCTHRRDQAACYTGQAVREVRRGAASRAAAACAAITAKKWRSECLFSAAEAMVEARGVEGISDASELCLASADFAPNCTAHLIELMARNAPDATVADPLAWDQIRRGAMVIHEVFGSRDGRLADLYTSRLWSETTRLAYAWTPEVTGAPLDVLPKDAVLQVRATAVARLVELRGVSAYPTLAAWVEAAGAALASRPTTAFVRPQSDLPHDREIFWATDGPGEEEIPAVFYLGSARRTFSEDPATDLTICVLEAIARQGLTSDRAPSPETRAAALRILTEGAQSTDEGVRWTATRLRDRPPVAMW